jgi:prepilin-type N-terminal cleavage/methylation domain-containing protein/prepilin-type processing-associated H-X9-DG protein
MPLQNSISPNRRSGLSLIEVVVVVALMGILIVLALSAVQAAREAARRAYCLNNLKQLGLALHAYQSNISVFPGGQNGHGYSLHTMILSYLDRGPLYDSINLTLPSFPASTTALSTKVSVFICPSDQPGPTSTSYAGCTGNGLGVSSGRYNGVFSGPTWIAPHNVSPDSIGDGLSNTIMLAEWIPYIDGITDVKHALYQRLGNGPGANPEVFASECRGLDRMRIAQGGRKGFPWIDGNMTSTLLNNFLVTNEPSCHNGPGLEPYEAITAGSFHPGGAHVLMADGSSRFVKNSINVASWRALSTRRGEEVLSQEP